MQMLCDAASRSFVDAMGFVHPDIIAAVLANVYDPCPPCGLKTATCFSLDLSTCMPIGKEQEEGSARSGHCLHAKDTGPRGTSRTYADHVL